VYKVNGENIEKIVRATKENNGVRNMEAAREDYNTRERT